MALLVILLLNIHGLFGQLNLLIFVDVARGLPIAVDVCAHTLLPSQELRSRIVESTVLSRALVTARVRARVFALSDAVEVAVIQELISAFQLFDDILGRFVNLDNPP